jgi:addiction module HigA family antidote
MRPIHPGEILREEFMVPMGLSASALSIALRERRAVSADTALRLARYFGTSAEFWLGLQSNYDIKIALTENGERIKQDVSPMERAA